jgi:hypothetical protein
MTLFNVHFTRADGTSDSMRIEAEIPKDAEARIKEKFPGAIIDKIKRWKAPAQAAAQIGGAA